MLPNSNGGSDSVSLMMSYYLLWRGLINHWNRLRLINNILAIVPEIYFHSCFRVILECGRESFDFTFPRFMLSYWTRNFYW